MGDENTIIKSSLEIALEKVKNTNISDEDLKKEQLVDSGKKIAAQFLKDKQPDMQESLENYKKSDREFVKQGIEQILSLNIILPRNDSNMKENMTALEGIVILKQNKKMSTQVCNAIEEHLKEYKEQKKEIYEQLKDRFLAQIEKTRQSLKNQAGLKTNIDVENVPEFQNQLRNIYSQIDEEYNRVLENFKNQLKSIA